MIRGKRDALFVPADPIRPAIVPLAAKARIPAIYQFSALVNFSGLASYGASFSTMAGLTAQYVRQDIQGDQPGRDSGPAAKPSSN